MEKRQLTMIACAIMALTCLLYILCTALPSWVQSSITLFDVTVEQHAGLWQACASGGGSSACAKIESCDSEVFDCDKLYGARAFMILAVLASGFSTAAISMNLFVSSPNPMAAQAIRFIPMVVLPLGIIGLALGISFYSGRDGSLGPASILGIVALILNVVAGSAAALIR